MLSPESHRFASRVLAVLLIVIVVGALFTNSRQSDAQLGYPAADPIGTPTKPPVLNLDRRSYLPALLAPVRATATPGSTPTAPPSPQTVVLSRYMGTVDTATLTNLGSKRGGCSGTAPGNNRPTDGNGFMILSFGAPLRSGNTYGAVLYDFTVIRQATIAQIEDGVKAFLEGYFTCIPAAQRSSAFLVVGVGVNNSYAFVIQGTRQYFMDQEHGRQWALMVNRLNDYINGRPGMNTLLRVVGAADMEPDFGPRAQSRDWAIGYSGSGQHPYYNFGTCDACPEVAGVPAAGARVGTDRTGGALDFGWTVDDVWYVSYGAPLELAAALAATQQ